MREEMKRHGMIGWNELKTPDVDAASTFYSELFGWEIVPHENADTPYSVILCGDRAVGGVTPLPPHLPDGVPAHWGAYVTVDDVDKAAEHVARLGGRVLLPPTTLPQIGRFCVFQDPQGAVLSMIAYTG